MCRLQKTITKAVAVLFIRFHSALGSINSLSSQFKYVSRQGYFEHAILADSVVNISYDHSVTRNHSIVNSSVGITLVVDWWSHHDAMRKRVVVVVAIVMGMVI